MEVKSVDPELQYIIYLFRSFEYEYLVFAHGATNAYFGSVPMQKCSKGMKTMTEVLHLRNSLLIKFSKTLS